MDEEKARLQEELAKAEADLARLRESLKGEVEFDIEDMDPEMHEREKNLTLISALEQKIEAIRHALEMMEQGTYGVCEKCGQPIDPERLQILPQATLCVKCKAEMERLHRRSGERYY